MHRLFMGASLIALSALASTSAIAADAAAADAATTNLDEVIVTGTRATGMKAADSAAPVQVLGAQALKSVGPPDLIQAIAQNLPSFNAQGFGFDASNLTLSAALRGLSPNDTLVLVNGKRRHTTANLAVDGGSPYSGSATADLGLIPVSAIDHVEVLQDGAAAQYGSDAIAGVVNIILKSGSEGGSASGTAGSYYQGGGDTYAWSFNNGFKVGQNGWMNMTLEERYHEHSQQGGPDARLFDPTGHLLSGDDPMDAAGVVHQPGSPNVNRIIGDPEFNLYNLFYNAGYDLTNDIQLYSFGSYSHREASSFENYRVPTKISGATSTGDTYFPLPNGFNPVEALSEDDYSFTVGIKGGIDGWNWDLSSTYGQDKDNIFTNGSANAQLFPILAAASATPIAPQRNFFDGTFRSSEWTTNLDIVRNFDVGLAKPVVFAFGAEARHDEFEIDAGEPDSYFGAGAQSFTGYDPTNAGNHTRDSYAGYVDIAADPIQNLHLDLAGRYETYSDFGDATVGKLTGRYDFSPMFAIRGTISNGFRAPTLAEEFYSGTNVSPEFAEVQLPPNSASAAIAGFSPLKPEKSTNYSVGFVAHPMDNLQITLDAYQIDISNRIVVTGLIFGSDVSGGTNYVISQAVLNAITAHGNQLDSGISYAGIAVFTNGVNTRTQGVELTANYASDFSEYGHVDWSAGFNYNKTDITKLAPLPAADLSAAPSIITQTSLLTPNALSALTDATPQEKAILGAYWTLNKWSVNLRESIYGPSSELVTTSNITTDLKVPTAAITDLEVDYKVIESVKLAFGANNLFNKRPPSIPNLPGTNQPADGGNILNAPMNFAPYGINGGYYYGRITLTF
ncbi:TonB-dependent receptor [Phenylobacterium sp.]|uniref:TonB-dependent receptor plug domain-containing protein n=1 Tax=Phenylobacterium sp. TaxID=1871053 RepID=UPI00121DD1E0|nr:TonB-dependent receptor [Phenylobacterium sp.]THD62284.1 MAG: TonB-dependent receptor [Phenylobacterium sp.]